MFFPTFKTKKKHRATKKKHKKKHRHFLSKTAKTWEFLMFSLRTFKSFAASRCRSMLFFTKRSIFSRNVLDRDPLGFPWWFSTLFLKISQTKSGLEKTCAPRCNFGNVLAKIRFWRWLGENYPCKFFQILLETKATSRIYNPFSRTVTQYLSSLLLFLLIR